MTDEQALDVLARQIDEANAIRDERANPQPAPGMQSVNPPIEVTTPAHIPATPATPENAGPPKVSADAERMVQAGLLVRGEGGMWTSQNPALQSFADEYNRFEAYSQATARRLVTDFDGFFQERADQLGVATTDTVKEMQSQIEALQQQLAQSQQEQGQSRVDQWAQENSSHLFVNGDQSQLTPFAEKYNAFAQQIDAMAKQMGQTLDTAQIHDRTVEMLTAAGFTPEQLTQPQPQVAPAQQPIPQPQPAVAQQPYQQPAYVPPQPQTFMQQAAQTAPRLQHNRLTEHPAQQPNGIPHLQTGKGGKPKLSSLIAAQQQNGQYV